MELIYLWIEDYFVLKNCAFNFSNQYLISQWSFENGINITIEDNPQYIESFFPANIKSVIAIVGENGVGKSSLLDFILRANHYPDTIDCGWIAVYKNKNNSIAIVHDSGTDSKVTISVSLKTLAKIKVEVKTRQEWGERYDGSAHKLLSIFYNPSLDLKGYGRSLHDIENGVADVSTNHLIISDNEDNIEKSYDQVENHRFKNVYRQFALAQSERLDKNELRIPESIEVRFNKNSKVNTSDLDSSASQLYELLDELGRQAVHDANGTIAR
jgi:ABC-type dipeptide/oligopeptide/nickel transport system ATPase component